MRKEADGLKDEGAKLKEENAKMREDAKRISSGWGFKLSQILAAPFRLVKGKMDGKALKGPAERIHKS